MSFPKLIGIHGHAGVGKDTVAEHISEEYDAGVASFADPVKRAASEAFGVPIEQFYDRFMKEVKVKHWNLSPREMAQIVGTELFRRNEEILKRYGGDFWIRRMELELSDPLVYTDTVVIPDVRFQNEADWILSKKGIIIHLTRPGYAGNVGIPGHASEAGINLTQAEEEGRKYAIVNDGSIQDLYLQVDRCIEDAINHNLI